MPVMLDPVAVAIGAGVGLLVGLTGMGGASLMTPLLVLVLGVRPVYAIGTDLIFSLITKLVGAAVHGRQGTIDRAVAFRLALGSIPGSLVGVLLLRYLETRLDAQVIDNLVVRLIGAVLITVSVVMLWRLLPVGRWSAGLVLPDRLALVLPVAGALVGFLVGLTSVGSGTLIVVLLSLCTGLSASRIVGTDILHAVLLLSVAGAAHLAAGNVNLSLTASLVVGSVPGVVIGSRWCGHFPERPLRLVMAGTLLVSGLRLI